MCPPFNSPPHYTVPPSSPIHAAVPARNFDVISDNVSIFVHEISLPWSLRYVPVHLPFLFPTYSTCYHLLPQLLWQLPNWSPCIPPAPSSHSPNTNCTVPCRNTSPTLSFPLLTSHRKNSQIIKRLATNFTIKSLSASLTSSLAYCVK